MARVKAQTIQYDGPAGDALRRRHRQVIARAAANQRVQLHHSGGDPSTGLRRVEGELVEFPGWRLVVKVDAGGEVPEIVEVAVTRGDVAHVEQGGAAFADAPSPDPRAGGFRGSMLRALSYGDVAAMVGPALLDEVTVTAGPPVEVRVVPVDRPAPTPFKAGGAGDRELARFAAKVIRTADKLAKAGRRDVNVVVAGELGQSVQYVADRMRKAASRGIVTSPGRGKRRDLTEFGESLLRRSR